MAYKSFIKETKINKNDLIKNSITFLNKYFDLELFLELLENEKEHIKQLIKILNNFSKLIVLLNNKKPININKYCFKSLPEKEKNILIIIYSIIQDSIKKYQLKKICLNFI